MVFFCRQSGRRSPASSYPIPFTLPVVDGFCSDGFFSRWPQRHCPLPTFSSTPFVDFIDDPTIGLVGWFRSFALLHLLLIPSARRLSRRCSSSLEALLEMSLLSSACSVVVFSPATSRCPSSQLLCSSLFQLLPFIFLRLQQPFAAAPCALTSFGCCYPFQGADFSFIKQCLFLVVCVITCGCLIVVSIVFSFCCYAYFSREGE